MKTHLQFSQVIPHLTDAEVRWLMTYVEHRHRGLDVDGAPGDFDDDGLFPNFGFQILKDDAWGQYAWFFSDKAKQGDIAQVAETVQEFIKHHRNKSSFSLTWADYAENLHPGQFDGGAIFVTAEEIKVFHAGEWVREQERSFDSPSASSLSPI